MEATNSSIDLLVKKPRSIEQAHADLVATFDTNPSPALARMIGQLELEIAERNRARPDSNSSASILVILRPSLDHL